MTTLHGQAVQVLPYGSYEAGRRRPGWLTAVSVAQLLFGALVLFISGALLVRDVEDRLAGLPPHDYGEFLVEAVSLCGVLAGVCHLAAGTTLVTRRRREPHGSRRAQQFAAASLVPYFVVSAGIVAYTVPLDDMFKGPAIAFGIGVSVLSIVYAILALAAARALRAPASSAGTPARS